MSEAKSGIPACGWVLDGVIDLMPACEDDYASCEWCGNEKIRFVHMLSHPRHFETLAVGCVCSGRLTGDSVGPAAAEKEVRSHSAKRERFPDRKWKDTRFGGRTITLAGRRVTVAAKAGGYRLWIDSIEGRKTYTSERSAMLAAFDYIVS
jgi:hypothetical protein